MKTLSDFSQEQSMAMTPDRTALVASDRKRNLGEAGFSAIGFPRIAENLRTGVAIPLAARSEAVHLRGSSCDIIYTKILGRSTCSFSRIPSPRLNAQSYGRLKGLRNMGSVKLSAHACNC